MRFLRVFLRSEAVSRTRKERERKRETIARNNAELPLPLCAGSFKTQNIFCVSGILIWVSFGVAYRPHTQDLQVVASSN
ncbi:hypothetical protein S245_018407 [Arachis hypogaea]|uniref:Uncharacterized protein n=1 Tax=Arachis hypogaea TaxID=3818 RepID=A0A445CYN4_ARAHY|nr:hypothetical protein Ahy_A05g021842 [Arachis hypogaea]